MEKKKHISPTNVLSSLFMFTFLSMYWLVYSVWFGEDKNFDIFTIVVLCIAVALFIVVIVLSILTVFNKKMKYGDEYTTKILHKAAFFCLRVFFCAIPIAIIVIHIITVANVGFDADLNDYFSARMVLTLIAGMQIAATFLFALLVFVFSKRGICDELQ